MFSIYRNILLPLVSPFRLAPEWGEMMTGLLGIGWAFAVLNVDTFGPEHTSTYYMAAAFSPTGAAAWLSGAAGLPIASILSGWRPLRALSTVVCGVLWTIVCYVSIRGHVTFSPMMWTALVCLAALFRSHVSLALR